MEAVIDFIVSFGVVAILLVVFAESGLLIGFFLPGDSLLFTAGFMVQQGILPINIHVFVGLLFLAAVLGDNFGYAFGKKVGPRLFERKNSKLFKQKHLEAAHKFYEKYGPAAIVLARFVPVVRTFAPIVAGVSSMKYTTFLSFNLLGGALWTASMTYIGFFAGKKLLEMGLNIELVAIIIIGLSVLPILIHALRDRSKIKKLWAATKHQVRVLTRREKL